MARTALQRRPGPEPHLHHGRVWAVAPVYHLAVPIFNDAGFGGRVRATPEDDDGVDVDALERKIQALEQEEKGKDFGKLTQCLSQPFKLPHPKRKLYKHLIYVVPTCANPSGKSMPVARREALIKLARKHDALIICDDVYDFLQWPIEGPVTVERPPEMSLPRLCDIDLAMPRADDDPDGFGYTVSNGSFSKISGPGVRTGWVEASPAFVAGLTTTASTRSGGAPSQLCAGMLSDLVDSGELERNIDEVLRPALQRRHRLLLESVRKHLNPLGVTARESSIKGTNAFGGYFLWLKLKPGFSADLIAHVASEEENLIIGYGNMFAVHEEETKTLFDDHFRLCFSWLSEEDLEEGVKRLAQVLARVDQDKDHYKALEQKVLGKNDMMQHV
ncbi:hypothetical protein PWT90_01840 [Aphanocladium album]|nr:hypothetical protein PWT90_01840 [Aphanocladium album]